MKVFKFKGAMLADAAALSDIKNKLGNEQEACVVVVSALKGVMPQLRSLYSQALRKGQGFEEEFKALKEKHLQMAEKLLAGQKKKEYLETLQFHLDELYDTLNQVAVLKDVVHPLKDYVLSKGDILSSLLFCALFDEAEWHDSRNFILTNDNFGAPEIQWEESCRTAKNEFKDAKKLSVVPGSCGKTREGYTISLGRVGLSLAASVLEACFFTPVKVAV